MNNNIITKICVLVISLATTGIIVYESLNLFRPEIPVSAMDKEKVENQISRNDILKDGVYEGTAIGYGGDVTTQITIKDEKIIKAEVTKHNETPEYFVLASKILDDIVDENTYDVDIVAGCTITSNAIKDGTHKALLKAKGEKIDIEDTNSVIREEKLVSTSLPVKNELSDVSNLKDGIYYGSAMGYNGMINVSVEIQNGRLININVISHNEDISYFNRAYSVISQLLSGSSSVDTVSGATITSRGLINAVNNALSKAGVKDTIINNNPDVESDPSKNPSKNPSQNSEEDDDEPDFDNSKKLKDGEYFAEANGYAVLIGKDSDQITYPKEERIPIRIKLTIKDSKIFSIDIISHNETPEYLVASMKVIDDFLAGKEKVDTVSGATLTSSALKSAIKDALKQAGETDETNYQYSDGVWYGQAYGFYTFDKWHVTENDEPLKTQTSVSVRIEDGQIVDVKLEYFGDDEMYKDKLNEKNAFELINDEVIRSNGVESSIEKFIINKTSGTGNDTDAVSGATFSGNAYINAIKDALNRSIKYTNDNIEQTVKYIRVLPHQDNGHNMSLPYGKPFNVGKFRIKIGYQVDNAGTVKEEIMTLKEAMNLGIELDKSQFPGINDDLIFTPMPEDIKDYTKKTNYDLKLTDPASGARAVYKGIQGARELEKIGIKEIIITGPEDKKITVPFNPDEMKHDMPFRAIDVKAVEVIDENGLTAKLKILEKPLDDIQKNGFGVRPNQQNILRVEIINPVNSDDSPIAYYYDTKSLRIEFNVKYNPEDIRSIKIKSKPSKSEYETGDTLNLSGLKVQLVDNNEIAGPEIALDKFEENGIIIKGAVNGEELNDAGKKVITLEKNIKNKIVKGTFEVNVTEKIYEERIDTTVRFYDIRNGNKILVSEAKLDDSGKARMGIPKEYYSLRNGMADINNFKWIIADQNGKEFDQKPEMTQMFMAKKDLMMVYREGIDGPKLVTVFEEERVDTKVKFYDITSGERVLVAEAEIPSEGSITMEIPEEYFNLKNQLADASKFEWIIEDQNGREYTPHKVQAYAYMSGKMMIYREGISGFKLVNLAVKVPEVREDKMVKFYDIRSGERVLIGEAEIPSEGSIKMEIPKEYFNLKNQLADAKKFEWIIEDQNGKEFTPHKEQAYAYMSNKMMIYRDEVSGFKLVNLVVKTAELSDNIVNYSYELKNEKNSFEDKENVQLEEDKESIQPEENISINIQEETVNLNDNQYEEETVNALESKTNKEIENEINDSIDEIYETDGIENKQNAEDSLKDEALNEIKEQ